MHCGGLRICNVARCTCAPCGELSLCIVADYAYAMWHAALVHPVVSCTCVTWCDMLCLCLCRVCCSGGGGGGGEVCNVAGSACSALWAVLVLAGEMCLCSLMSSACVAKHSEPCSCIFMGNAGATLSRGLGPCILGQRPSKPALADIPIPPQMHQPYLASKPIGITLSTPHLFGNSADSNTSRSTPSSPFLQQLVACGCSMHRA